ncbi:MAG: DNA replication/repair protein RecF [Pseudanabaenaceae cyanobacterium]
MFLHQLQLYNFRNYREQMVLFDQPKTIVVGANAQGKSNLLEAIQLLAVLQSFRVQRDRDLVQWGQRQGEIHGKCQRRYSTVDLCLRLFPHQRRTMLVNGVVVKTKDEFLGNLNAVLFSALDLELVRGSPEYRRDWLDRVLVQLEPLYIRLQQSYQRVLQQRNALLKGIKQGKMRYDPAQMELWNQQLVTIGSKVMFRRRRLIDRLSPLAQAWHRRISATETLTLSYLTRFPCGDDINAIQTAFYDHLQKRAIAEQQQGSSLVGPHRDDVQLQINSQPAKEYASQGQQRTLVLALKLAELELLQTVSGEPPLLLLDDVLAELDLSRQQALLSAVQPTAQTIITTTHLHNFADRWLHSAQILTVKDGEIQLNC